MRLFRVMDVREHDAFSNTRELVPTDKEWPPYPPDSAVFVFGHTTPVSRIVDYVTDAWQYNADRVFVMVEFSLADVRLLEDDRSANGWEGSYAHKGPIPESMMLDGGLKVIGRFKR